MRLASWAAAGVGPADQVVGAQTSVRNSLQHFDHELCGLQQREPSGEVGPAKSGVEQGEGAAIAGQELGATVQVVQPPQQRFAIGFQAIKREFGFLSAGQPGDVGTWPLPFAGDGVSSSLVQRPAPEGRGWFDWWGEVQCWPARVPKYAQWGALST
jgi:hypothetical protein